MHYEKLFEPFLFEGLQSTRGTLAINLALKKRNDVRALYLISAALALRNHVFLSSVALGWTGLDSSSICQSADSKNLFCRALLISDQQKLMAQEGILFSASAGLQVQILINRLLREFGRKQGVAADETAPRYYQSIEDVFVKLQVPIVMINTELDSVINSEFNESLAQRYPLTKGF